MHKAKFFNNLKVVSEGMLTDRRRTPVAWWRSVSRAHYELLAQKSLKPIKIINDIYNNVSKSDACKKVTKRNKSSSHNSRHKRIYYHHPIIPCASLQEIQRFLCIIASNFDRNLSWTVIFFFHFYFSQMSKQYSTLLETKFDLKYLFTVNFIYCESMQTFCDYFTAKKRQN